MEFRLRMVKKGLKKVYFFSFFLLIHRLNLVKKVSMKACLERTLNHYKHPNVEINRQHLKGLAFSMSDVYIFTKLSINTCTFPNNHVYFYSLGRYIKDHFTAFCSVFHIA